VSDARLIAVPYDSGVRGWRMGAGPDRLLDAGLHARLRAAGHAISAEHVELPAGASSAEIAATFGLAAQLADRVRAARADGALPIVLAGNCASAIGTLSGLDDPAPAILWLDAHADLNTPETTRSGFLDGMALAIATGRCWSSMAASVPGFRPIPDANICLIGARDLDPAEATLLRASGIGAVHPHYAFLHLTPGLDLVRSHAETAYLHIDLDVLDPEEGRVNQFAAPGGFLLGQVIAVIRSIRQRFEIGAVALTAYDPTCDPDARICAAAEAILSEVLA
jgi:arginase